MTSSRIVAKIYTGLEHRSLSEFDMNSRCRDEPQWRTHIPLLLTHLKDGKINSNQLELFYMFFSFFSIQILLKFSISNIHFGTFYEPCVS